MTQRMDWKKLLSTKRISQFDICGTQIKSSQFEDPRHPFERDCDQIIFSYPFRRLQDKTQVIPFPEFDFVHTRLTHSLEVASVGRSLGKLASSLIFSEIGDEFIKSQQLSKSDIGALVAGACLAHDIGNPPFGHSGEDSISYYFKQNPKHFSPKSNSSLSREDEENYYYSHKTDDNKPIEIVHPKAYINKQTKYYTDLSKFEGNANGFRILTQNCDGGINPTAALLGTFMKYPRESHVDKNPYERVETPKSFSKYGVFQSERKIFEQLANEIGLIPVDGMSKFDVAFHRHPLCFLMEASDDITYGIIDFEDGCRLGIIDFDKEYKTIKIIDKKNKYEEVKINSSPLQILVNIASIDDSFDILKVQNAVDFKQAISYLRAKVINVLINECFQIFKNNYEKIMTGNYSKSLIEDITNKKIKSSLGKMKSLVKKYVYNYTPVLQSEASGFEVMSKLIESFAISSAICFSCEDYESEKSKKLSCLLPDEYRPTVEKELEKLTGEEIYHRLMKIMDYVSGMTDNYATSVYRKISGMI